MNLQKKNKISIWESFRVWKIFKNQMMVPEIINLHAPAPIRRHLLEDYLPKSMSVELFECTSVLYES